MEKKFYVYTHIRKSDGRVFYVGKGHGRRAWSKSRQNPYWHNIVNKHGFTVEIVMWFDSEECAFSLEKALIKYYGRENLCNLTDGGEGISGYKFEKHVLDKLLEHRIGRKMSDENKQKLKERWSSDLNPSKNMTDSHRMSLSLSHMGKKHTEDHKAKRSEKFSGLGNPAAKKEKHWFSHDTNGLVYCAEYTLRVMFNLDRAYLADLVKGKKSQYKGWVVFP